jgi:WhiB family transcriptional regulator, redox-sensing transcriptional regulator
MRANAAAALSERSTKEITAMHDTVPRSQPQAAGSTWRDFAACLTVGPEIFFPEKGESDLTRAAKRICASCPVTSECLNCAFLIGADFGIFGGTTPNERRTLLRGNRRAAA